MKLGLDASIIGGSHNPGMRVEAWDADGNCPDLIDVAHSDAHGQFQMRLECDYIEALLGTNHVSLAFRIFEDGKPVGLANPVEWDLARQLTRLSLAVAATPPRESGNRSPAPSVVRGNLRRGNGTGAAKLIVRAYDRELARDGFTERLLGQATTAADGHYELRYTMPAGARVKPNLIVRAYAPPGAAGTPAGETKVAESELITSAPTVAFVDLGLGGAAAPRLSEHHTLGQRVAGVLAGAKIALADVQPKHIELAAGSAGITPARLKLLAKAERMARDAGGTVDAEIFYGLLRTGHAGGLDELLDAPVALQRKRLADAIDRNVISATHAPRLDAIVAALEDVAVARALTSTRGTSISKALSHARAPVDVRRALVKRWVGRRSGGRRFWSELQADPTLAPHAGDLETTLRLNMLFSGFPAALAEIDRRRQGGTITSLRDVARWQDPDWRDFVATTGVPTGTRGETAEARVETYAAPLRRALRIAYPTEYLRGRAASPRAPIATGYVASLAAANPTLDLTRALPDIVEWGTIAESDRAAARSEWDAFRKEARTFRAVPARSLLQSVVASGGTNPIRTAANQILVAADVDLERTTIDRYLAGNPHALDAVPAAARPAVVTHLKSVQRLTRLVATPEAIEPMLADGLDSALGIARVPRSQFIGRYAAALGGERAAHRTYSRAYSAATRAQLALTTVSQAMAGASPWAVEGGSTAKFKAPDYGAVFGLLKDKAGAADSASWPVLFGGDAWCDCDECSSAYGPAAYFVDLLHMIDPDDPGTTPADRLFARRPDLQYLKLTCDNTNIAIPTIDLANEILELRISARLNHTPLDVSYDNTGLTADELRAVPQNVIPEVYDHLESTVYPFTLPFSRSLAVVRTYLDQLGTSYASVFTAFGPRDESAGLSYEAHLAAEAIGLSVAQFQLIAGMPGHPVLAACYGYPAQQSNWQQTLAEVPELLRRTGIHYDDLYTLVQTYFLNPSHDPATRLALEPPKQCQIDDTALLHATDDSWQRLHRFIRLWRATGWSIADLDRTLFAVGGQAADHTVTLDAGALERVGSVARVAAALGRPLVEVLALWADLDCWGSDSLYQRLFQNRTVTRADDAAVFALTAATYNADLPDRKPPNGRGRLANELASEPELIGAHTTTILGALKIAASDLDAIWRHAQSTGALPGPGVARLTLANLSVLYRYTVLAKGLRLKIADLVELLVLTGVDPFAPGDPAPTLRFIDIARAVASSGFSVATLAYVYRHVTAPAQGPAPSTSVVADALMKVWAALAAVRQDTAVTDDPDATLLATRLAQLQPPEVVSKVLDALDPGKGLDTAARTQILADYLQPITGDDVLDVLATPDPTDEVGIVERKLDNQSKVLGLVSSWLRDSLGRAAVVSVVAATLRIDDAIAKRLLEDWIAGEGDPQPGTALDTLMTLAGGGLTHHQFADPEYGGAETVEVVETIAMKVSGAEGPRSARWRGHLLPLGDGDHQLVVRSDGAATIWLDGQPYPTTAGTGVTDRVITVTLSATRLVPIAIEYDAGDSAGSFELLWSLASAPAPVAVSADHLFPQGGLAVLDVHGHGPGWAWRRAHKAALVIAGFELSEAELDFAESGDSVVDNPFGGFHLGELPMSEPSAADLAAHVERWLQLAAYVDVREALPASDTTLVDALAQPIADATDPVGAWSTRLSEASGWDSATITSLLDTTAVDTSEWTTLAPAQIALRLLRDVADATTPDLARRLAALRTCIDLIKRIGVDVATLQEWTADRPTASIADAVIGAVRARYADDTEWFQVAQTRNDQLRQQQRDALVAYLMPRIEIDGEPPQDVNALFEHFLIDIEMCACGQTSRIKQAIASVQLFIQRILLGLEPHIHPTAVDPDVWAWNKQYRIWQANREIFLYPENWIDPELRVDRTPFFADLQTALSQGPLEPETVEAAYLAYLEKLEDVSRLKICALHWQVEDAPPPTTALEPDRSIDTLHVIARTLGAHPTYYYRTLLGVGQGGGGTEWTAWQKLDLDIQSDGDSGDVHMVMTTFNRRLYLFWALFTETPEPDQPPAHEGESPPPPLTHWDIRLAWSTYRNGTWSPKQVSSDTVRSDRYVTHNDEDSYTEALEQYQDTIDQYESRYKTANKAVSHVPKDDNDQEGAEQKLFAKLDAMYDDLFDIVKWLLEHTNELESFDDIIDAMTQFFFWESLTDLQDFEDGLAANDTTFDQFIAKVYSTVADWRDDHPNAPELGPSEETIRDLYADLEDKREKRDAAYADWQELVQAMADFEDGLLNLAIPSFTRRKDHTLWLSTRDDDVEIYVMRHDENARPRKLGYFSLSDDGRAVSAHSDDGRSDLSRQTPGHGTPAFNSFKIESSGNDGLDLDDLPDLLGTASDMHFYPEHWIAHPVTADKPRPFAITHSSDLHAGLPDRVAMELDVTQLEEQLGLHTAVTDALPAPDPAGPVMRTMSASLAQDSVTQVTGPIAAIGRAQPIEGAIARATFGLSNIPLQVVGTGNEQRKLFCFEPLHHPYVKDFIKRLERDGVDGLLTIRAQNPKDDDQGYAGGHFDTTFEPSRDLVSVPYAPHDVDFRANGAYAQYNWELFFHAPHLIAARLMQDARYEDAQDWLHYIFDPTTSSSEDVPARFWNVQWFRSHTSSQSADQLMTALATGKPTALVNQIEAQIAQWRAHPAEPHRIAALRTSAYQKAIVFKYLDNLIAWGDSLFTQNTIESINEATQLYVFASHLLGPRPEHVPQKPTIAPFCYAQLRNSLDDMSNTLLSEIEAALEPEPEGLHVYTSAEARPLLGISHLPLVLQVADLGDDGDTAKRGPLVFCVPANSKLLTYFDTLDDRLFKIRNCMNIEGVVQQLPLFEPPIDPALLVRAAAAGLDIGSILSDLGAPLPYHRFTVLMQKANELCNELKSLGGQLLSALEKQDAEALTLLRATHESALLTAVRDVKKQQIEEAETNRKALDRSRDLAQKKFDYYASRPFTTALEDTQLTAMGVGAGLGLLGSILVGTGAAAAYPVVDIDVGPTGMGAHATVKYGGTNVGNASKSFGEGLNIAAQVVNHGASMVGILAGYDRRQDEWDFQKDLATKELAQIDQQLAAADIRIAIATKELANQELQIENAAKIESTLRTKFTNGELYSWMVTQLSTTYYQAYKLAYDLAKRAERCYRHELGVATSSYIQFGYWDSLRKGLLAGDRLALDLKRLDAAYLQGARRDFEITRQVSLVLHDPAAFMQLRETGSCEVELPEELFDADYPGHYFRRLKTVSLSLPCVAGPYTPINCTLTLLASHVRTSSSGGSDYPEQDAPNDDRFSHDYGSIQTVATSHGQNDAGLFEVNFRDERYLPFEGAGAISKWRIELPKDTNGFDFDTLSDVVLKLSYTARDGGTPLAKAARDSLAIRRSELETPDGATPAQPLRRLFRVRYEFSDAWIKFRNALATGPATLGLVIDRDRFPFLYRGKTLTIVAIEPFASTAWTSEPIDPVTIQLAAPASAPQEITLTPTASDRTILTASAPWPGNGGDSVEVDGGDDPAARTWTVSAPAGSLSTSVRDLVLLVTYTAS